MENFKFSMQNILDISIDEEKEAKGEYETLLFDLNMLKSRLEDINNKIVNNSSLSNVGDMVEIQLKRNYLYSLETQKGVLVSDIDTKNKEVDDAYQVYIDKQIDRKMIEQMRDEELKEYIIKIDIEEQLRNDEFAIYSYVKNK